MPIAIICTLRWLLVLICLKLWPVTCSSFYIQSDWSNFKENVQTHHFNQLLNFKNSLEKWRTDRQLKFFTGLVIALVDYHPNHLLHPCCTYLKTKQVSCYDDIENINEVSEYGLVKKSYCTYRTWETWRCKYRQILERNCRYLRLFWQILVWLCNARAMKTQVHPSKAGNLCGIVRPTSRATIQTEHLEGNAVHPTCWPIVETLMLQTSAHVLFILGDCWIFGCIEKRRGSHLGHRQRLGRLSASNCSNPRNPGRLLWCVVSVPLYYPIQKRRTWIRVEFLLSQTRSGHLGKIHGRIETNPERAAPARDARSLLPPSIARTLIVFYRRLSTFFGDKPTIRRPFSFVFPVFPCLVRGR